MRLGARAVAELTVELGQPDVQVGGGPRVRPTVPRRRQQRGEVEGLTTP